MEISELDHNNEAMAMAIARLYCSVFNEEPWNEEWSVEDTPLFTKPNLVWFVLQQEGQVIGFTAGAFGGPEEIAQDFNVPRELLLGDRIGYLAEVGVDPQYRRSGLARELSNTLLAHFCAAQVNQFVVRTRPGTGNFGWYSRLLSPLYTYPDGRVIFGQMGVPTL